MGVFVRLRLLFIFIGMVRDPLRTDKIFTAVKIVHKIKDAPVYKKLKDFFMAKPEFRKLYEERYLPEWPTMEQLQALPEGSFGHAVYLHMLKNNLSFSLFPRLNPSHPIAYMNARIYQDHDLWHPLLGFGTEIEDELGLQAFGVAQYGSPFGSMLIAGGILHLIIKNPLRAPVAIGKIADGYRLGEQTRFLPGMKLIDMLPLPLSEVRRAAGLPPTIPVSTRRSFDLVSG